MRYHFRLRLASAGRRHGRKWHQTLTCVDRPSSWPRQSCGLPVACTPLLLGLGAPLRSAMRAEGLSRIVQNSPRRARPTQGRAEERCWHAGGHASEQPPSPAPTWPEEGMAAGKNRGAWVHGGGGGRFHTGGWRALVPAMQPWRLKVVAARATHESGRWRARAALLRSRSLARPTGAPPPGALRGSERARARSGDRPDDRRSRMAGSADGSAT